MILRRCAVVGHPVAHSLSPVIHTTAYQMLGLSDWHYEAIDVAPGGLAEFVASLDETWVGLSVTAPHKADLLSLGEPDAISRELTSANTLILDPSHAALTSGDTARRVFNTDVTGMLSALAGIGVTSAESLLMVGAGATARSALAAAHRLGVRQVCVIARNAERAHASLDAIAQRYGMELRLATPSDPDAWPASDLLISTIPAEHTADDARALVARARAAFEVVYTYYPSQINVQASQAGIPNADGIDLLVAQAIGQLELMTGQQVPPAPLIDACLSALGHTH